MSEPQAIITSIHDHDHDHQHDEESHAEHIEIESSKPKSPLIVSSPKKPQLTSPLRFSSSLRSSSSSLRSSSSSPSPIIIKQYQEPYSIPPTLSLDETEVSTTIRRDKEKERGRRGEKEEEEEGEREAPKPMQMTMPIPMPYPANEGRSMWHRLLYPAGVSPTHRRYEHWVGRIGFGAKGLIYGFVGGMTCASAIRFTHELNGSPQGAFILIGDFPGGRGLLIVMLFAILSYVAWRWWECFTYQGADASFSPFKNFFTFRLSPFISGCVYIAYGYYIIEILSNSNKPACYPECWRHSSAGKAALVLFGVAFSIACITQLMNAFTRKWYFEIDWGMCTKYEKYTLLGLGHAGFVGRSGLFLFVAILMFRALAGSVHSTGNTLSNGVNQFIGTGAGRVFMFIFGFLTLLYGLFAVLCTRYRFFPTPPPSGTALIYRHEDADLSIIGSGVDIIRVNSHV